MDFLLIVGLAVILFLIGWSAPILWSFFSIWTRARHLGLTLTRKETLSLSQFYMIEDSFLLLCKEFKRLDSNTSISDIVRHRMADGDTQRLLEKFSTSYSQNHNISLSDVIMLDLSGKDITPEVNQNPIDISFSFKLKEYSFAYTGKIRVKSSSIRWVETDHRRIEQLIINELSIHTESFDKHNIDRITKEILNQDFWQKACHGTILHQQLSLA